MKLTSVTNDAGRVFNVKRIEPGEKYGLNQCLTADAVLIEFWDATYSDHSPLGQFVSRYYAKTLRERPLQGLCLEGSEPAWQVSAHNMARVHNELL